MCILSPLQADLDNLKLGELPVPLGGGAALHARFQLEALLLTGQCIDPGARRREEVRRSCRQHDGLEAEPHRYPGVHDVCVPAGCCSKYRLLLLG